MDYNAITGSIRRALQDFDSLAKKVRAEVLPNEPYFSEAAAQDIDNHVEKTLRRVREDIADMMQLLGTAARIENPYSVLAPVTDAASLANPDAADRHAARAARIENANK